jgi:hypothetical protein
MQPRTKPRGSRCPSSACRSARRANRRRALKLHDLHHVVTGFGTDLAGEAEISAWELRRGLGGLGFYVGAIIVSVALLGLFIGPRRTLRAWRASRSTWSLFQIERDYEEIVRMSVGELRRELGVPEGDVDSRRIIDPAPPTRRHSCRIELT